MTDFKPFSFTKSFIIKRKLQKLTDKRIIYQYNIKTAYCNLKTNTIYLPFVEPLEFSDLKILLEHEKKHFEITKKVAKLRADVNLVKAQKVLNLLEDIIINESISRKRLETVFKKLRADTEQLTLWQHFDDKEKITMTNKLKRAGIFKDIDTEKIIDTIDKTVKIRKEYSSLHDFVSCKYSTFKEYYNLFDDSVSDDPGDGPGEYDLHYNLPDWDLMKKFEKLIKNLKTVSTEEYRDETFVGHRINRKFFEDISCIKPFTKKTTVTSVNLPKIVILLDCSGSMAGYSEKVAKSFIVACLRHLDATLIAHNQYYTNVIKNPETAIKLPMTGDEHFHKLQPQQYSCDIFIVITDVDISEEEARGLKEFGEKVSAKRKYILCVDSDYYSAHDELDKTFTRVLIDDTAKFIEFVKKLCYSN